MILCVGGCFPDIRSFFWNPEPCRKDDRFIPSVFRTQLKYVPRNFIMSTTHKDLLSWEEICPLISQWKRDSNVKCFGKPDERTWKGTPGNRNISSIKGRKDFVDYSLSLCPFRRRRLLCLVFPQQCGSHQVAFSSVPVSGMQKDVSLSRHHSSTSTRIALKTCSTSHPIDLCNKAEQLWPAMARNTKMCAANLHEI